MRHIRNILLALSLSVLMSSVGFVSSSAMAVSLSPSPIVADSHDEACQGLNQVSGNGCGGGQAGIDKVLSGVVNIVSYIAGAIAVIMIIIAGVKYTTSGGDANSVGSAKTTLIYALVGIAVAVLAQVLVHFVIGSVAQ